MKPTILRRASAALTLITTLFLIACGGGSSKSALNPVTSNTVTLSAIHIAAFAGNMSVGQTYQLSATASYSDGSSKDLTSSVTWASANAAVATVSKTGLVTATGAGTTNISGTFGGVSGASNVTVNAATLVSIAISGYSAPLNAGVTQQLTATGSYSDGTTKDISSSVTWSSANSSVATVSNSGLLTAKAAGTVNISAAFSGVTGSSAVTVNAASLVGISIGGYSAPLTLNGTLQLSATGSYSDGSTKDITASVTWASSNSAVAVVTGGLVTAKGAGSANITGTYAGVTGTSSVTVTSATLVSIAVSGYSAPLTVGATVQLTATGTYSDGSTSDLTSTATWASTDTSVAGVSSAGAVTAVAAGTTSVSATSNGVTGSVNVQVKASLVSISVSSTASTVDVGKTLQLVATGTYSDSTTADVTSQATWTTSDQSIATVDANGLLTGVAPGTAQITATVSGVSGNASFSVQPALASIAIQPSSPTLNLNTTQQLTAYGTYTDGSQQDLSAKVQWTVTDTTIATVDNNGLLNAVAAGTTSVSAVLNGVTGTTSLTVNGPQLASIILDQDGVTVPLGLQQQLSATGVFNDGSTAELTGVTFTSSDPTTVSIDANGVATANVVGSVTVTATLGSVSGTGTLTVGPQTLVSVAVTPTNPSIPVSMQQQFTVTGTFSDSSTQQLTTGVVWSSSDSSVASIDQNGLAKGLALGTSNITAQVGALSSSATLTVTTAKLVSIAVTPATAMIPAGVTQQFTATGTYDDTTTLDLTSTANWVSSDGTTATINDAGLATAIKPGTVNITASSGAVSGTASLNVDTATVSSLTLAPLNPSVTKGTIVHFTVTATYSDGSSLDVTSQATWTSSKPNIANVQSPGRVRAHKVGTATIKAAFGGNTASTTLTVTH